MMDIKQLEYFLKLAETGSLAKAADVLYISRQGLSRSISMLEQELSTPLFLRTSNGTELSEAGRILLPFATRILTEYNTATQKLYQHANSLGSEKINFAVPYGFFENVSTDMYMGFFEAHPQLQYSMQSFSDVEVYSQFLKGGFDFSLTTDPRRLPELDYYPLFRNYRCISVGPDHPLNGYEFIRISDLKDIQIACGGEAFYDYPFLIHNCEKAGFKPRVIPLQDTVAIYRYSVSGKIATLNVENIRSPPPVESTGKHIFFAPEDREKSAIDINVITIKGKQLDSMVVQLIKFMQDYCQDTIAKKTCYPYVV